MASSDPKRSKDITTPRHGSPTPYEVGPIREKKPEKKIEPTVIVAIISAVVTLVTALLSSPVLLAFLNKTPTVAPSVAGLGIPGTLLPVPEEADNLSKATILPAETASTNLVASPTLVQADTNEGTALSEPSSTATNVPVPESTAVPTQAAAPSLLNCLAVDVWFPTPATLNPGINDGCWDLADWGFTTNQGQLVLLHNPAQDQQRGIYLPISGDADIQFTLQLNEFRTRSNKGGFLHFGIVQNDPFNSFAGGFLSYQQPTPGTGSPVRVLVSGSNQATQNILILEKGFQQTVSLSVQGDLLTVSLNGEPVGDLVGLTSGNRAFWIGYVLPGKGELDVVISGFTVQAQ